MNIHLQRFKTVALMLGFSFMVTMMSLQAHAQVIVQIGTGTNTQGTTGATPYGALYEDGKVTYLILKSELNAAGIAAGTLSSLALYNL